MSRYDYALTKSSDCYIYGLPKYRADCEFRWYGADIDGKFVYVIPSFVVAKVFNWYNMSKSGERIITKDLCSKTIRENVRSKFTVDYITYNTADHIFPLSSDKSNRNSYGYAIDVVAFRFIWCHCVRSLSTLDENDKARQVSKLGKELLDNYPSSSVKDNNSNIPCVDVAQLSDSSSDNSDLKDLLRQYEEVSKERQNLEARLSDYKNSLKKKIDSTIKYNKDLEKLLSGIAE